MSDRIRPLVALLALVLIATVTPSPPDSQAATRGADIPAARRSGVVAERLGELTQPGFLRSSRREQALRLSLAPRGAGSLVRGERDSVRVTIALDSLSADVLAAIRSRAMRVLDVARHYQVVTADVPVSGIAGIAHLPGVRSIAEVVRPALMSPPVVVRRLTRMRASSGTCGWLASKADSQMLAEAARSEFGVDGSGVTVAVMSSSFGQLTSPTTPAFDVKVGALPGTGNPCGYTEPVDVIQDSDDDPTDEGRGMLQYVHALAPGAHLMFATGAISEASFAENIRRLTDAGADIIVDDVVWNQDPFFQDGIIADAVAYARSRGVTYFTGAGNFNVIDGGNEVGSWEAPAYRPMTCPAAIAALSKPPLDCMDFDPDVTKLDSTSGYSATRNLPMQPTLQWAEPVDGVTTQFDLYLLDGSSGDVLATGSGYPGKPVSWFSYENTAEGPVDIDLVIARRSGSGTPRVKYILTGDNAATVSGAEWAVSAGGDIVGPSVQGHSSSDDVIAVGAIAAGQQSAEPFSSRGPVTMYFEPVVGVSPAPALVAPLERAKPDLMAIDNDCTTFFGVANNSPDPHCPYLFGGTSGAAPHAAAVAALMLDAAPGLAPAQLASQLGSTATPVLGGGLNISGAGLVNAQAAVAVAVAQLPGTPAGVAATAGDGSATVTWVAPSTVGASSVNRYELTVLVDGVPVDEQLCPGDATSCLVPNLTNGTSYQFTVTASNQAGSGQVSARSAAVVPAAPVPAAQAPVGCGKWPSSVRVKGITTVLAGTCRTNIGRKVKVSTSGISATGSGARFTVLRGKYRRHGTFRGNAGTVRVRTYGRRMSLTITWRAASALDVPGYRYSHIYRLRPTRTDTKRSHR